MRLAHPDKLIVAIALLIAIVTIVVTPKPEYISTIAAYQAQQSK